jgi:outer membrane protein TolC
VGVLRRSRSSRWSKRSTAATRPWRNRRQYRQAQAWCAAAGRRCSPSLDLTVGKNRSAQGTGSSSSSLSNNSSGIRDTYNAQLGVSWEIDLWGKLRET